MSSASIAPPRSGTMQPDREDPAANDSRAVPEGPAADSQTQAAVRELLAVLPADVLEEIRGGKIDACDPAFVSGLMDHASRLSVADPRNGRRILGRIIKLRKQINRTLRDSDPQAVARGTVSHAEERTGRNAPCPCGSGRKFKQCCMRKA